MGTASVQCNIYKHTSDRSSMAVEFNDFADDTFIIFSCMKWLYLIQIPLKLFPKHSINNELTIIQIRTWFWSGDKPLSIQAMALFTDSYLCHSSSMC